MTNRDPIPTSAPTPPTRTFISCDWGTSTFRLLVIGSYGPEAAVLATLSTNAGIAATHADWQRSGLPHAERIAFYRAVLEKAIGELASGGPTGGAPQPGNVRGKIDLHGVPLVISGMASSSIGMLELPYKPLPFDVAGTDLTPAILAATAASPRVMYLLPGVRSADDVIRGEETQLIGCGLDTLDERVVVFPGTHSKHLHVRSGQATAFRTYMTGEVFGLLAHQSILAASVAAPVATSVVIPAAAGSSAGSSRAAPPDAFFAGLAASNDAGLLHNAFLTRTNQLFNRYSKADNYHFLSGLLIGDELRELAARLRAAPSGSEAPASGPGAASAHPQPSPSHAGAASAHAQAAPSHVRAAPPHPGAASSDLGAAPPDSAPPCPITLLASPPLLESYAAALSFLGFRQVTAIDADAALIAGHSVLFARFGATVAP